MERERAASHLGWLAGFAHLLGYSWLERRAGELQLALLRAAHAEEAARLAVEAGKLSRRLERTPLLRRKLRGIAPLPDDAEASGPVVRGGGSATDARAEEEAYRALGFEPVIRDGNDALSRLGVRLAEVNRSLDFVDKAGSISVPKVALDGTIPGTGTAAVETPRGTATLRVTLEGGAVKGVELDTPSTRHLGLVGPVSEQRELADALIGVASLDLSPWEVVR
jgi:Ni,Fe-hydrogenase III large subunit